MTEHRAVPPGDSLGAAQLKEGLCRPEAYGGVECAIGFLQTHISLLFFVDDRVYKVKKPVDFGFLNFTTLERRKFYCDEEVRLNRRLAPNTYLGVVPITQDADGALHMNGAGDPVKWAVEMVRLPEHRMFSKLLEDGNIDNDQMNRLASVIAEFHAACATGDGVDEFGQHAVVEGNHLENFEQLEPYKSSEGPTGGLGLKVLSGEQHQFLHERAVAFLDSERDLFDRRVRTHRIRDGHGDLHAGNLCFTEDGIVAYDCIEFSNRFRCGDVAAELAFLAMDLDYRGYPSFGTYLVKRYAETCKDDELEALEPFYKCYRAVVRGKVTAMAASDETIPSDQRESLRRESMRYIQLAVGYHLPPVLVMMCGLPACGKSWLAKRLVRPLRASLLRSDVRRKRMPDVRDATCGNGEYGEGLYSAERRASTYDSLLEDAIDLLKSNRSVIVDATFSKTGYRTPYFEAAKRHGFECVLVHVTASDELTRNRLRARSEDPHSVSDAGVEVYERELGFFDSPTELAADQVVHLNSGTAPSEEQCSKILDKLIRHAQR